MGMLGFFSGFSGFQDTVLVRSCEVLNTVVAGENFEFLDAQENNYCGWRAPGLLLDFLLAKSLLYRAGERKAEATARPLHSRPHTTDWSLALPC